MEIDLTGGWINQAGEVFQTTFGYTFDGTRFLSDMMFSVSVPTLNAGEGAVDFQRCVSFSWQQRWIYGPSGRPTFSTFTSVQVPYDEPRESVDFVLNGILALDLGPGVGYLNAEAKSNQTGYYGHIPG